MPTQIFYILIFLGMGVNGFFYLAWLLSPPNPDRVGFWFFIYFLVFPYLGILGIIALLLKNALNIPSGIGVALLLYVGILTILLNSYQLGLTWMLALLPTGSYEFIHMLLYVLTLGYLIILKVNR
ncbi:hypothetical protein [Tolypothrix sp. VBCCA 56010]|uniref:hypothetical protein n=1 Tax=Tolypothrix sp. VBCCA 56010 TaxID=3137731 RepID=UPI003D7DC037